MNRICSDPKYRDILTLILTQIKDRETYKTFYSICKNTNELLSQCHLPVYFLLCRLEVIEVIGKKVNKKIYYSSYSISAIRIYKGHDYTSYGYSYNRGYKGLDQVIHKCGDILYAIEIEGQSITELRIDLLIIDNNIHRICDVSLLGDSDKWIVHTYKMNNKRSKSRVLESPLHCDIHIPEEFIRNGVTYFETKQGIEHLNQIKQFAIPYIIEFRNESHL
jgi:hypothetical protein